MKILLCWQGISGYLSACWKALAATPGIELSILSTPSFRNFDTNVLAGLDCHVMSEQENNAPDFNKQWINSRNPDVILLCGWIHPIWNRFPYESEFKNKPFILAFDTPWRGMLRQRLAPFKLAKMFRRMDCVIVPGERAWQYARHLGFPEKKVRRGMYGIDFDAFSPMYDRRLAENNGQWPRRFLYVGRYAEEKAIEILVEAYRLYCKQISDPWPMTTCGAGEKKHLFENVPNLTDRGFVQPVDQPAIWASHGAFVIASRYDPWPLVIVEACAAGLPILCTESCGSSVELVRQYYNGTSVGTDDPQSLANGMLWLHRNHDKCPQMGQLSQQFAAAYSAQIWATRMLELCNELT